MSTQSLRVLIDGEPISPELVLVSPELGVRARALLPDVDTASEPLSPVTPESAQMVLGEVATDFQAQLGHLSDLVDQIAAGSLDVQRRLGELESRLAPLEAASRARIDAVAVEGPVELLTPADVRSDRRGLPAYVGALLFVGSIVAALVVLELLPIPTDHPRLTVASEGASPTGDAGVAADRPTRRPSPAADARPARQGRPAPTRPRPASPAEPSVAGKTKSLPPAKPSQAPPASTATSTVNVPPVAAPKNVPSAGFQPARLFVWAPVEGARYYSVKFFRDGEPFYATRVSAPRVTIPVALTFASGSYRWVVQPAAPSGRGLAPPIVDSTFTID